MYDFSLLFLKWLWSNALVAVWKYNIPAIFWIHDTPASRQNNQQTDLTLTHREATLSSIMNASTIWGHYLKKYLYESLMFRLMGSRCNVCLLSNIYSQLNRFDALLTIDFSLIFLRIQPLSILHSKIYSSFFAKKKFIKPSLLFL